MIEARHIHMPRESHHEILVRLAVNALAYAINEGNRDAPERGGTPEWVDRHRSAPGGPLISKLAQDYADLEFARMQQRQMQSTGQVALTLRKIERLETAVNESLKILGEMKGGSAQVATDGPWRAVIEPHRLTCSHGTLEQGGMTLLVNLEPQEWLWLEEWRHEKKERETGKSAIYRYDIAIKADAEAQEDAHYRLKLRENLEIAAAILRKPVNRKLKLTHQYSREQHEYWNGLAREFRAVGARVTAWKSRFPNTPHPPTLDIQARVAAESALSHV